MYSVLDNCHIVNKAGKININAIINEISFEHLYDDGTLSLQITFPACRAAIKAPTEGE